MRVEAHHRKWRGCETYDSTAAANSSKDREQMATELKDRIATGLAESRMIVLVVQVLLGFACRAAFEPGFEKLPALAQSMKMVSFALLMVAPALLLAIPAYHQLAADGHNTPRVEVTFRRLIETALWPFAAALGVDIGVATFVVLGGTAAFVTAIATTAVAVAFWYAFAWFHLASHNSQSGEPMEQKAEPTPLDEKIKQVLTECRIVLPGTQAFLGFQMIVFLTEAFTKLPRSEQLLL
ncbi:MAG: hypothetical protein H0X73_10995 [Chthoniobacterales bacterium]|nr:hypothetical protein [Chthoniobacterales bacterium]